MNEYKFIGRSNGNSSHSVISIYRTVHDPATKQTQFWCGIAGQGRVRSIAIVTFDPFTPGQVAVPQEMVEQACRLQNVEFLGWCL